MPTDPITTLAELDEALATLREPKPSELPKGSFAAYSYENPPAGSLWRWNSREWVNTFRPTTNAADALAMLEWWRDKGKGHTAVIRVMAKGYEVIAQHTYENYLMAHGSYTSERFPIAASVAVARACGLSVELEDQP